MTQTRLRGTAHSRTDAPSGTGGRGNNGSGGTRGRRMRQQRSNKGLCSCVWERESDRSAWEPIISDEDEASTQVSSGTIS